jgi:hypothetical protein
LDEHLSGIASTITQDTQHKVDWVPCGAGNRSLTDLTSVEHLTHIDFSQDFVKVPHIKASGLPDRNVQWYYMREVVKSLLSNLDGPTPFYVITGPSCTGKSTFVWMWACKEEKKSRV